MVHSFFIFSGTVRSNKTENILRNTNNPKIIRVSETWWREKNYRVKKDDTLGKSFIKSKNNKGAKQGRRQQGSVLTPSLLLLTSMIFPMYFPFFDKVLFADDTTFWV